MTKFSIFQQNNLFIGTRLAAELPSSSSELRSFIIIGSYDPANRKGRHKPSKILNRDHDELRFWIRKYEINKKYIGSNEDISDEQLASHFFKTNIEKMEQLEDEIEMYLHDFSLFKTVLSFRPMIPFS